MAVKRRKEYFDKGDIVSIEKDDMDWTMAIRVITGESKMGTYCPRGERGTPGRVILDTIFTLEVFGHKPELDKVLSQLTTPDEIEIGKELVSDIMSGQYTKEFA
jgi:hypothetical protein